MRLLILATSYPTPENIYEQVFVRTRVRGYRTHGLEVTVLNFQCRQDYSLDDVPVVTWQTVEGWGDLRDRFDLVVSHAPNLRQHFRFLWPRAQALPPVVFTFHGHETIRINRHFPPPFPWLRGRAYPLKRVLQEVYDSLKLWGLKLLVERLGAANGVRLVYVSHALQGDAYTDLGVDGRRWEPWSTVIPNPVGAAFEKARHQPKDLLGDFVTIRPIDVSKMAIDLVVECARQNPNHTFHVYGKGKSLRYLDPPANLTHFDHFIENDDIPPLMDRYRAALMISWRDSQPVMMSEMATMGMPVVGSDIPSHRESLDHFPRMVFLDNHHPRLDAQGFLDRCETELDEPPATYHQERVIGMELALFQSLL